MATTTHNQTEDSAEGEIDLSVVKRRFAIMLQWLEQANHFAQALDWVGPVKSLPEGSKKRKFAQARDKVDSALSSFVGEAVAIQRVRAESAFCDDLLVPAALRARGDGPDALHLMRRMNDLTAC